MQFNDQEKRHLFEKLDSLERGIYGDKLNEQKGLIERVSNLEKLIEKGKKYGIFGVGILVGAVYGVGQIVEFIFKKFFA